MPYDITDAKDEIREIQLVIQSLIKIPQIKQHLVREGLIQPDEIKMPTPPPNRNR